MECLARLGHMVYCIALLQMGDESAADDVTEALFVEFGGDPEAFNPNHGPLALAAPTSNVTRRMITTSPIVGDSGGDRAAGSERDHSALASVACHCRFAVTQRHHDRLVRAPTHLAMTLDLLELAVTWREIDYSGQELIPPGDWLEFMDEHQWPERDIAERVFGVAIDIAREKPARVIHEALEGSGLDLLVGTADPTGHGALTRLRGGDHQEPEMTMSSAAFSADIRPDVDPSTRPPLRSCGVRCRSPAQF
jgi:hypothetical protein